MGASARCWWWSPRRGSRPTSRASRAHLATPAREVANCRTSIVFVDEDPPHGRRARSRRWRCASASRAGARRGERGACGFPSRRGNRVRGSDAPHSRRGLRAPPMPTTSPSSLDRRPAGAGLGVLLRLGHRHRPHRRRRGAETRWRWCSTARRWVVVGLVVLLAFVAQKARRGGAGGLASYGDARDLEHPDRDLLHLGGGVRAGDGGRGSSSTPSRCSSCSASPVVEGPPPSPRRCSRSLASPSSASAAFVGPEVEGLDWRRRGGARGARERGGGGRSSSSRARAARAPLASKDGSGSTSRPLPASLVIATAFGVMNPPRRPDARPRRGDAPACSPSSPPSRCSSWRWRGRARWRPGSRSASSRWSRTLGAAFINRGGARRPPGRGRRARHRRDRGQRAHREPPPRARPPQTAAA